MAGADDDEGVGAQVTIADYEPEDAWDASDSARDQVLNLGRRLALLDGGAEPQLGSLLTAVDQITERIQLRRQQPLSSRDQLRLLQLLDDLRFVRSRLP